MNVGSLKSLVLASSLGLATICGMTACQSNKTDSNIKENTEYCQSVSKKKSSEEKDPLAVLLPTSTIALATLLGAGYVNGKRKEINIQNFSKENLKDIKFLPENYLLYAIEKKLPIDKIKEKVEIYNDKIHNICSSKHIDLSDISAIEEYCNDHNLDFPVINKSFNM